MFIKAHQRILRHHIWYGQSNAVQKGLAGGYTGSIATAAPAPHSALMFNGSLAPNYTGDNATWDTAAQGAAIPPANLATLVDLDVDAADTREAKAFGFARQLYAGSAGLQLHSLHAAGGYDYPMLKKGTQPYRNVLDAVDAGRALAAKLGLKHEVASVEITHGEGDFDNAAYFADLQEWCADLRNDILARTGQTSLRVLITQVANWCYAVGRDPRAPASCLAQLAAHEAGFLTLVTPTYHIPHDAGPVAQQIHWAAYGERLLGEKAADAMLFGATWSPLRPTLIQATGSTITLSFAGRQGNLQFKVYDADDEPNGVVDPGAYGFRLCDATGAALGGVSISAVSLINGNSQVQITCSGSVPAGAWLGYADYGTPDTIAGPIEGPRGCLCDSDTTVPSAELQAYRKTALGQSDAKKVDALVNWCVVFRKPITLV